ncbi:MAG: RcnB family protein [Polaromonas sp.]
MKANVWVAALTAVSLSFSGLAFAQGRDDRRGPDYRPGSPQRGGPPGYQGMPQRAGPPGHQGMPQRGMHQQPRGYGPPGMQNRMPPQGPGAEGRGAGPDHNFYRGGRLPREYRNNQYVVNDWRDHHLKAPPRGHYWVQVGADYVLVAIATGIIVQILLSQ